MATKRISSVLTLSFLTALVISLPTPALAQTTTPGIRFTTSPLPVNLVAIPGTTVSTDLKFRNSGTTTEHIKMGLLKFTAGGASGSPQLQERQPGDDYFNWVSFAPTQFDAPPNVWQTVKMTINVPPSAAFGYYYAVTFSRAGTRTPNAQEAQVVGSTATLVLLEAKVPGAKRDIQVESFATNHPWYEFLPVKFNVGLHNSGNVHAAPHGTIYITRGGQQSGQIDINAAMGNVLPSSTRVYSADWSEGFPVKGVKMENGTQVLDAKQQPVQQLQWDWSHANQLRFGKYTAHLVLAYDNGSHDVPLEATTTFWVIPWRLMLGAIAIPLIPAILVFLAMRWWMRHALRRRGSAYREW